MIAFSSLRHKPAMTLMRSYLSIKRNRSDVEEHDADRQRTGAKQTTERASEQADKQTIEPPNHIPPPNSKGTGKRTLFLASLRARLS